MEGHTQLLVRTILEHPFDLSWSVQGLGMMRVYLSDAVRLHIWDDSLRIPNVSAIHTHPWHLHSTIVAGIYRQRRYIERSAPNRMTTEYYRATIRCGENAFLKTAPERVYLEPQLMETYRTGESYCQNNDELHTSFPLNGTVTLVTRTFLRDREFANVYWQGEGGWVDAAPRPATREEIESVTQGSLVNWF